MELRLTAKMADSLWESNGHKFAAPLWYIFLYHAKGWQDPKAHRDSEELGVSIMLLHPRCLWIGCVSSCLPGDVQTGAGIGSLEIEVQSDWPLTAIH